MSPKGDGEEGDGEGTRFTSHEPSYYTLHLGEIFSV
jgi:hypothetical protein